MLVTQPSVLHRLFITPCTTQHAQQLTHSFAHPSHACFCLFAGADDDQPAYLAKRPRHPGVPLRLRRRLHTTVRRLLSDDLAAGPPTSTGAEAQAAAAVETAAAAQLQVEAMRTKWPHPIRELKGRHCMQGRWAYILLEWHRIKHVLKHVQAAEACWLEASTAILKLLLLFPTPLVLAVVVCALMSTALQCRIWQRTSASGTISTVV